MTRSPDMDATPHQYTLAEEVVHAVTHGVGALLSIAGLTWMLYVSAVIADPWRIVASAVYGASLVALFLASTLYHALYATRARNLFHTLDHCAIYLLIAGTYTPFLLVAMRDSVGWWLFGTIWTLAMAGIITKLWFRDRFPRLSLAGYLAMGWLVLLATPAVLDTVAAGGIAWLVAGGLSYTLGAAFYAAKRIPYHHAIWHLFVLAGGVCHFLAVALYVLPEVSTA
ncbi:PAQR family membrane homeostasis protein TrhA [Lentisalinibacter orientalis]|uniref:PAQR family membrane homeostasis protein TrhA n=1 Tax=Lentisalinibacter orientalis TaxID=2992241 RepID=UPI0038652364